MQSGGLFGTEDIPWFNGGLLQKIDVPMITPADVTALKTASTLNWSAIDVAIFGTLLSAGSTLNAAASSANCNGGCNTATRPNKTRCSSRSITSSVGMHCSQHRRAQFGPPLRLKEGLG